MKILEECHLSKNVMLLSISRSKSELNNNSFIVVVKKVQMVRWICKHHDGKRPSMTFLELP